MTKQEALDALKNGKRVRHYYFSEDEWVEQLNKNTYIFEDGCHCPVDEFWRFRQEFEDDWSIVT